jgi:Fe-S cluster assembly scaffold protein SufB
MCRLRVGARPAADNGGAPAGAWPCPFVQGLVGDEERADIGHEATVSRLSDEQVYNLQSRGLSESASKVLIVNGFFEQFTKELPMEYAVELNRLTTLQMDGSIG